ncbi:perakine reductase-like [Prunus avium]|uniref:Perakine reductase-like n=1 Tax=Prunus avium TaxID=42229 RepID=A0A6P5U0A6_PRUAV|nr:perakine reductase-like [Prunus avium]
MEGKPQVQIPTVKLGSQGLEVSRLGFGCRGLSGTHNFPLSHEAGCSVIKEAFDRGITFFDTSDVYDQNHDNEILVGKALKQLPREKVQLATKFGTFMLNDVTVGVKGTPEYVRACCEASLKRLAVSYIELYYQHRVDVSVVRFLYAPIEDTMEELKKLVNEGKIRYIGLSEGSVDTIIRAHVVHPITAVQMEYSLWSQEIKNEIIPLCRKLGIGIVSYSPLGRGLFGGKAAVESLPADCLLSKHPRFNGENLEKNKLLYSKLVTLAAKHACTAPQLALAWLLHHGNDIIPIPGTTKVKNLDTNVGSLDVELTKEDLKEICDAVPIDEVRGDREFEFLSKYAWNYANTPSKQIPIMETDAN